MAETETTQLTDQAETNRPAWAGGVIGGLIAGVVMGMMLSMMMTPVIEMAIPALYGLQGILAGWIAHLVHSALFGIAFAVLASVAPFDRYTGSVGSSTVLGISYGIVIWVVAAGFVMPIWLSAVGFPMAPTLPNFDPMSLVGHAVFGAVLGMVYPYVSR